MENIWPGILAALLSGGIIVKVLEYFADWLKTSYREKKTAKDIVDSHLDPLLKAADEIAGKTRSLAERDFSPLIRPNSTKYSATLNPELIGLLYLYAKFWSRIEILKYDSLGVSITSDKRGVKLSNFIACLESQRIRLVDRVHQKAIGEITTETLENGELKSIGVVAFAERINSEPGAINWIEPLLALLMRAQIKAVRQKFLVYGVVIHAFVDTLDPEHHSTHPRPAYPHKLSKKSKRDIKYRVFGRYLRNVKAIDRYTG